MKPITLRDLFDFALRNNISLDAEILYQRIEDIYFTQHRWDKVVVLKPDMYNLDKDEYLQVFTPIKFSDDGNIYLTAHY